MDYIKALEEERNKILVFERELPLSLQLVTQAIEACKKQQDVVVGSREEITNDQGPILEEFISLRPSFSSSDEENHQNVCGNVDGFDKKPDWLRSVQLWNQPPEPKKDFVTRPIAVNATRIGGAFHPFEREKVNNVKAPVVEAPVSSTTDNTNGGGGGSGGSGDSKEDKEKEGNSQRKVRRCWSPEIHRKFLNALQRLGGSSVATPKQIRELMKVDGLTNDEVKSHLQKYRIHTRRPSIPAIQGSSDISPEQQPHIVLVGGIWVPPPEYTAGSAALNGAPVASLPSELCSQQNSKKKSERTANAPINSERRSEGDDNCEDAGRTNSDSSATSSSSVSNN